METANKTSITVENIVNAPVEKVWQALTDVAQMKQWYFDLPAFKAEPGFRFAFTAGSHNEQWLHHCQVTAVIPLSKIAYTWRYEGYAGESEVTFELFAEKGKTRLVLTHTGLDTFPQDIPALHRENFTKGWNLLIGERLKAYVEKQ